MYGRVRSRRESETCQPRVRNGYEITHVRIWDLLSLCFSGRTADLEGTKITARDCILKCGAEVLPFPIPSRPIGAAQDLRKHRQLKRRDQPSPSQRVSGRQRHRRPRGGQNNHQLNFFLSGKMGVPKLIQQATAGFSPCFRKPGIHLGIFEQQPNGPGWASSFSLGVLFSLGRSLVFRNPGT